MSLKITFTAALLMAAIVTARLVPDHCCRVYNKKDFRGRGKDFCLSENERQFVKQMKNVSGRKNRIRSVECGIQVDATICPAGATYSSDPLTPHYVCEGDLEGQSFGALQRVNNVEFDKSEANIIVDYHPWVAKGPHYISLTREEKSDIIWEKITESNEMGEYHANEILEQSMASVFDEEGDEFDCRVKTIHSTGNVAKIFWVSEECKDSQENDECDEQREMGHTYTGIFKGGDSGFARLSDSTSLVVKPGVTRPEPFTNTKVKMMPAIAVKFLRDGVDSANTFGSAGLNGSDSYNFFDSSMFSAETGFTPVAGGGAFDFSKFSEHIKSETYFQTSVGNSNVAEYDQWGNEEVNPKFPFNVEFRPTGDFLNDLPKDTYEEPMEDYMQRIQVGETLYDIFAQETPVAEFKKIGKLVLGSRLVTSLWGDNHMFFRHQRIDDDVRRYRSEWEDKYHQSLLDDTDFDRVRPEKAKADVFCPFAFLFH